nr:MULTISPECIES: GMC family oxidoreductase [unclassified Paraburkholderia]
MTDWNHRWFIDQRHDKKEHHDLRLYFNWRWQRGSIIARRLADANIGSVLLIEAGPPDEGIPAMMDISRLFELDSGTDWAFLTKPKKHSGRQITYSRARMRGGCGNHNDCAYLVPPEANFDSWRELGADGWSGKDVRPYFEHLKERVTIEQRPERHLVSRAFIEAGVALGLPKVDFGIGMLTLNVHGRLRNSSSVAYLHPLTSLPPNLEIQTDTLVGRIKFIGSVASACLTGRGRIAAGREIIVCAGSIQPPQLLLSSGIGDAVDLRELGIDVVHHSPGVGKHPIDHYSVPVIFETAAPVPDRHITPYEAIAMLNTTPGAQSVESQLQLGPTAGWVNGRFGDEYQASTPKRDLLLRSSRMSPEAGATGSENYLPRYLRRADNRPQLSFGRRSLRREYSARERFVCRRLGQTESFKRIISKELLPGPDIIQESDLREYIRKNCQTYYHAAGTCRAGSANDPNAVASPI